jgi:hypothetical protein
VVAAHLPRDDLRAGRLVCCAWARDLGAFVTEATAIPAHLAARRRSTPGSQLLAAFPHCQRLHVDVSSPQQQAAAPAVIDSLARSSAGGADACASRGTQQCLGGRQVWLSALPRSFLCRARQDCPLPPPGAAGALFAFLQRLPRQVGAAPAALGLLHSLALDAFPAQPCDWSALLALPALRQLLLPPVKPALPHSHLRHVAGLTQLTQLLLSVQARQALWLWRTALRPECAGQLARGCC